MPDTPDVPTAEPRARSRALGWAAAAAAALLVVGAGFWLLQSRSPVSVDEARSFADSLQESVLSGDIESVCDVALSSRMCREALEEYRDRAPVERAEIFCTWPLEGSEAQVIVLTGTDRLGEAYVNHMPVMRDSGRLVSSSSVYWRNYGVPNENPTTADSAAGPPTPVCR